MAPTRKAPQPQAACPWTQSNDAAAAGTRASGTGEKRTFRQAWRA